MDSLSSRLAGLAKRSLPTGSAFSELIRSIGESKSKLEEDAIVLRMVEIARQKLRDTRHDARSAKELLIYLMYIEMLGHDTTWAQAQVIRFCTDKNLVVKKMAYLAVSLLIRSDSELIIMVTATVQADLRSDNFLAVCSALQAVNTIASADLVSVFVPSVQALLSHERDAVKKKAALALHRLLQLDPGLASAALPRLASLLASKDPGVATAALPGIRTAVAALAREQRRGGGGGGEAAIPSSLVLALCSVLKQASEGRLGRQWEYHRTPAPFVQLELLRTLGAVCAADPASAAHVAPVLLQVSRRAATHANGAGNALASGAARLAAALPGAPPELLAAAAGAAARLLDGRDGNARYAGVDALARVAAAAPHLAAEHQLKVVECLRSDDRTLRARTLELLLAMAGPANARVVANEALAAAREAPPGDPARARDALRALRVAAAHFDDALELVRVAVSCLEVAGDGAGDEPLELLRAALARGSVPPSAPLPRELRTPRAAHAGGAGRRDADGSRGWAGDDGDLDGDGDGDDGPRGPTGSSGRGAHEPFWEPAVELFEARVRPGDEPTPAAEAAVVRDEAVEAFLRALEAPGRPASLLRAAAWTLGEHGAASSRGAAWCQDTLAGVPEAQPACDGGVLAELVSAVGKLVGGGGTAVSAGAAPVGPPTPTPEASALLRAALVGPDPEAQVRAAEVLAIVGGGRALADAAYRGAGVSRIAAEASGGAGDGAGRAALPEDAFSAFEGIEGSAAGAAPPAPPPRPAPPRDTADLSFLDAIAARAVAGGAARYRAPSPSGAPAGGDPRAHARAAPLHFGAYERTVAPTVAVDLSGANRGSGRAGGPSSPDPAPLAAAAPPPALASAGPQFAVRGSRRWGDEAEAPAPAPAPAPPATAGGSPSPQPPPASRPRSSSAASRTSQPRADPEKLRLAASLFGGGAPAPRAPPARRPAAPAAPAPCPAPAAASPGDLLGDLLGDLPPGPAPATNPIAGAAGLADLLGGTGAVSPLGQVDPAASPAAAAHLPPSAPPASDLLGDFTSFYSAPAAPAAPAAGPASLNGGGRAFASAGAANGSHLSPLRSPAPSPAKAAKARDPFADLLG